VGAIQVATVNRARLEGRNEGVESHGDSDPCRMQLVFEQVVGPHHARDFSARRSERLTREQKITFADRVHLVHHGEWRIAHIRLVVLRDIAQVVAEDRVGDVLPVPTAPTYAIDQRPRASSANPAINAQRSITESPRSRAAGFGSPVGRGGWTCDHTPHLGVLLRIT